VKIFLELSAHAKGKVLPDDNKKDGEVSRPPQL
jgi:hypothetical protein